MVWFQSKGLLHFMFLSFNTFLAEFGSCPLPLPQKKTNKQTSKQKKKHFIKVGSHCIIFLALLVYTVNNPVTSHGAPQT